MTYAFRIERLIDAPIRDVFVALTDPGAQSQWWSDGSAPVDAACDLRVGGKAYVEWTADEGHICRAEQVFLEIDRPYRIVYTEIVHEPEVTPYECVLSIALEERDGKTLFALHHQGFPTAQERDKHERGTEIFLDRLARFAA